MSKELLHAAISQNTEEFARIFAKEMCALRNKKEATMQVTYNGFTGELVKLERKATSIFSYKPDGGRETKSFFMEPDFNLIIYDEDKREVLTFTSVRLEDVKFSGGEVSFGG